MKTRLGFVSNSSSSSFVLDKTGMTKEQIEKINQYFILMERGEGGYNTHINQTSKYFFGEISDYAEPTLSEVCITNNIDISKLDMEG